MDAVDTLDEIVRDPAFFERAVFRTHQPARNRRHRSVELRRAARTVYEAAWEMGGIGELWDASLLLDRCADMAGDALPLDVDQIVCGGPA